MRSPMCDWCKAIPSRNSHVTCEFRGKREVLNLCNRCDEVRFQREVARWRDQQAK
jgi:hypothetical protein